MQAFSDAVEMVGGPAKMARLLGVSTQAVCFWRDGKRTLPHALGAQIEQETGGRITRRALFPNDWHRVWPELSATQSEQDAA